MKRKFITEYGISYMNSYSAMVTAHQLMKGGELNPTDHEHISKCHIYIIAARPSPYFKPESLNHENDILSGKICYKIDGKEAEIDFGGFSWKLEDDAIAIDCKYPYKEIRSHNFKGEEVTHMPASHLANLYITSKPNQISDLNRYEVLYVGQALGEQGNRSAIDRLRSHSTLQKILALTSHDYPDKEIMVFMYQFEHAQVVASIDGREKDADNTDKNEARLMNAINNPPNKKQKIGMIEAGLIRYFQPRYNEIFKIKFPSMKHRVLKSCYDLDITALIVELDSTDLNYCLYSQPVRASTHHLAQIDLVSSSNRQSFFFAAGLTNNPEIIK